MAIFSQRITGSVGRGGGLLTRSAHGRQSAWRPRAARRPAAPAAARGNASDDTSLDIFRAVPVAAVGRKRWAAVLVSTAALEFIAPAPRPPPPPPRASALALRTLLLEQHMPLMSDHTNRSPA